MVANIKKWCKLTAAAFIVSTFFLLCADRLAKPDYTPHHPAELFQQPINHQCIDSVENNSTTVRGRIKTILLWNAPQRPEVVIFGTGHDAFVQHGCPVSDCELVNSPYQYPERPVDSYDAIVFNINDQFGVGSRRPYADGNQRPATQRYVFFTQEPPPALVDQNLAQYRNYFNWTMTYRMDSDIRFLYGRIRPKPSAPKTMEETEARMKESTRQLMLNKRQINRGKKKKKKLVAAMISHCTTDGQREKYVKQLKKHVKVDVYGWCDDDGLGSGLRCDTHELLTSTPECYNMLESNYKFYLSFENAICQDYVTEKFFHIMSLRDIVPVVYGGADYAQLAPEHSYIDALHFEPKKLAAYLEKLAANETLYNEYLWWKDDYVVEAGLEQMVRHGFCHLCRKLHVDNERIKSYPSLFPKWHPGRCSRPNYKSKKSPKKFPFLK
ncbi:alpha-(1,3)-fucosyltransferase C-like [Daphnia pulex]|uniref:alpha-(1,3)-fucosyltransferase C-like n=1 Tax=Daphnia pulex TaxID=6669 RepID=UPI001EE0958A|nr:alpha-(1,3)-fucosyltransferase C-like [Daphnia pulex]